MADLWLRIGTDPTEWILQNADNDALTGQLSQASPVVLPVTSPLQGRLVLSVLRAGGISLRPPGPVGAHPTGVVKPRQPLLYLPSVTGPTQQSPGYELAAGTDLAALENSIVAAMQDGTLVPIRGSGPGDSGLLVLSGASLAFAVICPSS